MCLWDSEETNLTEAENGRLETKIGGVARVVAVRDVI